MKRYLTLFLLLLALACIGWGPMMLSTKPASGDCAEESCASYEFCCSWEDGSDEINTGGTYVWDTEGGTVVRGAGTLETCDNPNSVTFNDPRDDYLGEGAFDNLPAATARACFKITAESLANGEYVQFYVFMDQAQGGIMYLSFYQDGGDNDYYVIALVNDDGEPNVEASSERYDWDAALPLSFCAEMYYDDAGDDAGWRLWDTSCVQQIPAAGTWCDEADAGCWTITGLSLDVDSHQIGTTWGSAADNPITIEIDRHVFEDSKTTIGCPSL